MKHKLFTIMYALLVSAMSYAGVGGYCGPNVTWELTDEGVLTISGIGDMDKYYQELASNDNIKTIIISDGVTSIAQGAFRGCGNLSSVTIGKNVDCIHNFAFYYCNNLTSVTINSDKFYNFHNLCEIFGNQVLEYIIGNGVTNIGKNFNFSGCSSLTSITIPESVTEIADGSFLGCSSLPIVDNIRYADTYAIEVVDKSLPAYSIKEGTRWIGANAFSNCSNLTSLEIPNSVIYIGDCAFRECSGLTEIICKAANPPILRSLVKSMDEYNYGAFYDVDKSIPLYVSAQSIDAYKTADQWKDFTNILPIEGIDDEANTGIGVFSVSTKKQVAFSQGNLQYRASTDTWRFAENQWDYIGEANNNISATYSGWIDLFGWGTGNNPTNSITTNIEYTLFNDWGKNPIYNGGDEADLWRTLTRDEWFYLLHSRTNFDKLFGLGSVAGVNGLIILPDNWDLVKPEGVIFTPSMVEGLDWHSSGYYSQRESNSNHYTDNTYTIAQWLKLEAAGCVFLPAAGYRKGTTTYDSETNGGCYWCSTVYTTGYAYDTYFSSNYLAPCYNHFCYLYYGLSVRLVKDITQSVQCGTIETTDGITVWDDELPYTWEGITFTEAGTETKTLTASTGCDSTVTFTLRVRERHITLQENKDAGYYDLFSQDYNGQTVTTATLNRQFGLGKWATLCLPFNVNKSLMIALGLNGRVYEFRHADLWDDVAQIYFAPAQSIEAGKGYIVNANAKLALKTSFVFPNVTINTDSDNGDITTLTGYNDGTGRGNLFLVGTLRTGLLQGSIDGNTYLGMKNNMLYYPNSTSGTAIRAYRGFFRSTEPMKAQKVSIFVDGEESGELVIENGEVFLDADGDVRAPSVRKYIENGVLYIERNGLTYTAQGQRID